MSSVIVSVRAMVDIDYPTYLDHIRTESARFREVLADCDPAARVPGCPDWAAADLLWHLAEVQWFWAKTVRTRPAAPDEVDVPAPTRPSSYAELLESFDDFSHSLVVELERADPSEQAWHWSTEHTVGTSYRRQAHEALIHRLDAEQTAGTETPLDPTLAADGVLELVEVMYGGPAPDWGRIEPGDKHVRFELTGPDGSLLQSILVQPCTFYGTEPESGKNYDGPHLVVVDDPDVEPDALVRGAAADVDAWLWKRRDESGIDISGDQTAYDAFRAAVTQPLD
jgi:uncharacterized protein (TIGR03083 family)